jgi:hypothetical protein
MKELDINARPGNALIDLYAGKRGFAWPAQRWQILQHITASPGNIGQIAGAAFVLLLFEHNAHLKLAGKHHRTLRGRVAPFGRSA